MRMRSPAMSRRTLLTRAAVASALSIGGSGRLVTGGGRRGALATVADELVISFADGDGRLSPHVERAAAEVGERHPGLEIDVDAQRIGGDQFLTRLALAIQAGDAPDVFHLYGGAIGALVEGGAIAPLDEYVAAWPDWDLYPDYVRNAVTYEGHVWAVPYALDVHFLYYRRDLFARAGLPSDWRPANVDDILATAGTIKRELSDVIPYILYAGQGAGNGTAVRGFLPLLWAYGGDVQDDTGRWIGDSCSVRDAIAYYARAFQSEAVVPPQVVTTPNTQAAMRQLFGQGRAAILFEGSWAYGPWTDAAPETVEDTIGYGLFPAVSGGSSFTVGGPGLVWFISAQSPHRDLAWEFIQAWNTKDTVAALGREDPHPPARLDAAEEIAAEDRTFLVEAIAVLEHARYVPLDPRYRELIAILHDVTGSVATGRMGPDEAVEAYAANLERALGPDNVVTQPCP